MDAARLDTVTVLFTDAVASTSRRTEVGEREAEDLRQRLDAAQAAAVAAERGDVVKGLGDGVMAVFPAADHALRAAARIARTVAQLSDRLDRPVQIRVGLSAGDVRREDGDVFGTPAIEAARLCAVAEGGQILLSGVVRMLAGSWTPHRVVAVGPRALKGLATPVDTWALDWHDAPAPSRRDVGLLVDEEFPFVGRDDELDVLEGAWTAARLSARTAVLISGEPGVGKTRMVVEMAGRVAADGGVVLAGRCQQDSTVPLEPFQHAFADYAASATAAEVAADAGPFAPELARHLPALAEALAIDPGRRDDDRNAERFRLFAGLTRLLQQAAARRPVLLVVDDLQWADDSSRALLDHLLGAADLEAVCVLGTIREPDDRAGGAAERTVRAMRRLPDVTLVRLEGLGSGHLRELTTSAGAVVDDDELWRRSRGHPFFAVELLRHARAGGGAGVPASVRDLVQQRIAQLDDATTTLLTVGAMVGYEFDVDLVAAAGGLAPDTSALDAADRAVDARLLLEVPGRADRYQFNHSLVADAVTAPLTAGRAARLHHRIALALRDRGAPATRVAAHLLRAVPRVAVDAAVDAARAAAHDALAAGEPEQAAAVLEQALRLNLADAPALRAAVQLDLGDCLNVAGRADEGVAHFEDAAATGIALDRFDLLHRAALRCWAGNPWYANADDTAPRLLRAAIDRCPPGDDVARAALEAGLAAFSIFSSRLADRDRITADAVARVRAADDPATLASVLVSRHVAITSPLAIDQLDAVQRELEPLDVALPLAVVPGDLVGVSASDFWRADGERFRRAAASFDLDEPRLSAAELTVGCQLRAAAALLDGLTADARTLADRGLRVGAWGDASTGNHAWQLLLADWLDGRTSASRERVAAAYRRFGGQPMRLTHAWVEAVAGDRHAALAALERVRRERVARIPELFLGSVGLAAGAAAVVELGARAWAAPFIEAFAPISHLMSGVPWAPFPAGAFHVGRLWALLGDIDAADEHFVRATAIHERMRAPAYVAMTQAEHGLTLLGSAPDRARGLLAAADAFARRRGLGGVRARVAAGA
jgi:class 3 adenylate cyclase/tetratricopeptide (TPR) repeat protein